MNQVAVRVIVGIALLVVATVTFVSLKDSDRWRRPGRNSTKKTADPYDGLSHVLAAAPRVVVPVRDPFRPGGVPTGPVRTGPVKPTPPPAPVREQPVLTAIMQSDDGNHKAVIHLTTKNYSVAAGDLFDEYRVVDVTPETVTLERAGQQIVLRLPKR